MRYNWLQVLRSVNHVILASAKAKLPSP
jgi:hypothetical protein